MIYSRDTAPGESGKGEGRRGVYERDGEVGRRAEGLEGVRVV